MNSINSKKKPVILDSTKIAGNFVQTTVLTSLVFGVSNSLLEYRPAVADISGLTPCAESKGFAKLKKQELKELQKRLKKYEPESAPALALKATMERTEKRFDFSGQSGLLCGADGLPHLIADPGFAVKYGHAGDIFIPTFGFLFFAGWLGHAGRLYLEATRDKNKEIIIDVPLAASCFGKALGWPILVSSELTNGTLLEKDTNITTSPR
jgi:photosystem I subunit 3